MFAGIGVAEIRRLKQLKIENTRLYRLVVALALYDWMPQDVLIRIGSTTIKTARGRTLAA